MAGCMKRLGVCIITLLLVAGCGNSESVAQRQITPQFDLTTYYTTTADVAQCAGAMTMAGGIKYKCTQ